MAAAGALMISLTPRGSPGRLPDGTRLTRPLPGPRARCDYADVGPEENKALVRRYYHEVLTGRDRDLLAQLLDPCFVSHGPGGADAGAGAYAAAVGATHAAFPDLAVTVHDQVAGDDRVATR